MQSESTAQLLRAEQTASTALARSGQSIGAAAAARGLGAGGALAAEGVARLGLGSRWVWLQVPRGGESHAGRATPDAVVASTRCTLRVSVEAQPSAEWMRLAVDASRFAATREVFLGFLTRLGTRCRFVTAYSGDGLAAATCLGIWSGKRLGMYAMLSQPAARRRGAGRTVLHALAQSALADGAIELYLLVELGNLPARALYTASGFEELYRYHYPGPSKSGIVAKTSTSVAQAGNFCALQDAGW